MEENKPLVFIVDDSRTGRRTLSGILSKEGFRIIEAVDGESALSILSETRPDIILLDVIMPGLDGLEVCKRIKKNPATENIPIIFITSQVSSEDKLKGFNAGGEDYITKPYNGDEVLARIKTHMHFASALKTIKNHSVQLQQILDDRTNDLIISEKQASFARYVQGIVHNISNPLTNIIGYSQMMQRDIEKFKKLEQNDPKIGHKGRLSMLNNLEKRLTNLNNCSGQLLEMRKTIMRKSKPDVNEEFEYLDLNKILQQELQFLEVDMTFKYKVEKEISLMNEFLPVYGIPSIISQVFQNLARNALDALSESCEPKLSVLSGSDKESVWFIVSDNGKVIPDELKDKIFEPFFTTKSNENDLESKSSGGTGLGLYMCRRMVSQMNGKIKLDNSTEYGKSFIVQFPRKQKPAENDDVPVDSKFSKNLNSAPK